MKIQTNRTITGCLIVLLSALGCGGAAPRQEASGVTPVAVTTALAEARDVSHAITQTGTLLANETVIVKSEAEGKIKAIHFQEGTPVLRGDLLVKIEDTRFEAEVRRLTARIEQYRLQLANTRRTLKRKQRLRREDVVPEQELDDLTTRSDVAQAKLIQAEARLTIAKKNLADTEVRAPFNAVASERLVAPGDYLAVGSPIVTLVQTDPLKVSIRVFEKFKEKLRPDMPVDVKVEAFPGRTFSGRVFFISPDVDVPTRSFLIKALIPNPERLLSPGMFAGVSIEYERHRSALVIPWEAVVELEDRAFVFAVKDGRAREVPLKVLKIMDGNAEVSGDLAPGQSVILDGKYTVEDGQPVLGGT